MSQISVNNLTFAYDGSYDNIFENVSFRIDTNWKLGFTGRNGRGKTTFLNLLLGKYEYSGSILADVEFEYFPYDVLDKGKCAAEIAVDICGDFMDWELMRELSLLEISEEAVERPFNSLSNGEQTKLLLAMLFLKENSFLLIDEPTNHLDMRGRELVGKYLKSKKGYILVSHDRSFLDNCVDHILSINKTDIEIQKGDFSSWLINKERRDMFELSENEKLKKDIRRLKESAAKSNEWADKAERTKIGKGSLGHEKTINSRAYIGEKSRRMQQRKKNLERRRQTAIEEKSDLLRNIEGAQELKISQLSYRGSNLAELKGVSVYYDGIPACKDVSFAVEKGERIAICGKNGAGKSSVLKLICGEEITYTGDFIKGAGVVVSYVSQDTSFLSGKLSDYAAENNIDESLFKAILRKLDFSRIQLDKDMRDFSGGQKKKTLVARSLCEKAHLHIWDEPLNFIDVISRIQIEKLLLEFKPTLLFVEHDTAFCRNVATKWIYL